MWLLKTEPNVYSYDDLEKAGKDPWDGVTNAQALIHLRAMQPGDEVVIYHTGDERRAVGLAKVASGAYPDPELADTKNGKLVVVDVTPVRRLAEPKTLAALKDHPAFVDSPLVRISRLSVVPLTQEQYRVIVG